ncbi:MAG: hypothetical protein REI94_20205 [Moraxellaceae bacterium]|nr:hypothetical protein [Moraxellaceae bacterium]
MDIIKTITDWPVIVQGALGSALFWAFLEGGQRLVKKTAARVSSDQKSANSIALAAHEGTGSFREWSRFICIYAALHYILKASIVAILAMVIGTVIDAFSLVGYLIATYFLFRALAYVPHTTSWGSLDERKALFAEFLTQAPTRLKEIKAADAEQRPE